MKPEIGNSAHGDKEVLWEERWHPLRVSIDTIDVRTLTTAFLSVPNHSTFQAEPKRFGLLL